ncbi:hypothetical protein DH2020_033790 [Rehmannia glutinosa]|uniref:Uncharacterized protein n=1 Tax=Rehmannia glutinosa TaxID=99300 RepID=A0ABR0VF93_REHGL
MAEKKGGIVKRGHEETLNMAVSLLEEFGLPLGLLSPLANVLEIGFVRATGYMWIVQQKKVEHDFNTINKIVSYNSEISAYLEKSRLKKLKGVTSKEMVPWPLVEKIWKDEGKIEIIGKLEGPEKWEEVLMWAPVSDIWVDDPPTGRIDIKSLRGTPKRFPVEAFYGNYQGEQTNNPPENYM